MKDIHARKPIDRNAARVTSVGEHYEPRVPKANLYDSDLPITIAPRHPRADNLEGRRVGRLTVIGYHGCRLNSKGEVIHHRWVVRCDCGRWSVRKARVIKNPKSKEDCCDRCLHLRSVKYKYANNV